MVLVSCIGGVVLTAMGFTFMNKGNDSKTAIKMDENKMTKEIYFAGGCFWGTEHFFKQVRGVTATEVGYANGTVKKPSYKEVSKGVTGAAETVKVIYDPEVIDLDLLIDLYFKTISGT